MQDGTAERIEELFNLIDNIEARIAWEAGTIKERYKRTASEMPAEKSYFLNGLQTGSVVKSYLLTRNGIEVPGEKTITVEEFIDSVLRFANYPKRKIEVLRDLLVHLDNIYKMIGQRDHVA